MLTPEELNVNDHVIVDVPHPHLHEDLLPEPERPPKKPVISNYGTRSKSAKLVQLHSHAAMAVTMSHPNRISYDTAVSNPQIRASMKKTIISYFNAGAWKVVPKLPSDYEINTRWVHQPNYYDKFLVGAGFKDAAVLNYKSRITPQGFRFRPGVDYDPAEVSADTPHLLIRLKL